MKYRITPLNTGSAILCLWSVWILINGEQGMAIAYLIPAALLGLLIDFIFQILFKNYRQLAIIELVLILFILLMNSTLVN